MTYPARSELERARQWSVTLATTLDEITGHVGAVAQRLADGWPDARGREWTERLLLLRRSLERDADDAAELGRAIDRSANDAASGNDGAAGQAGPRLGGTGARRADDARGVRIPRLNDAADDHG